MKKERIEREMKELETKICYKFQDVSWLEKTMCSIKSEGNYLNDALATVGDAVLKLALADIIFSDGAKTKGEITQKKQNLENNKTLYRTIMKEGIIDYAYNDKHFCKDEHVLEHEKVRFSKHDSYLEAIIGAVFYDSNYETVKEWIKDWLLPLLEKHK